MPSRLPLINTTQQLLLAVMLAILAAPGSLASAPSPRSAEPPPRPPSFSSLALGTLPGFTSSTAIALNNSGQALCQAGDYPTSLVHSFLWDQGTLIDLGTLTESGFVHDRRGGV